MNLVNYNDITNASRLNGFGGEIISRLLMQILRFNRINKVYKEINDKTGIEFIDSLINILGIKYDVSEEELKRIPKTGAFITVSNQPFGGVDSIILLKILTEVRPDFKIMANSMLQKLSQIKDLSFPAIHSYSNKETKANFSDIKLSIQHLTDGKPLGMFPAGAVSTYFYDNQRICDLQWHLKALRFIRKANVPVVPVYFKGSNSKLYYLLGRIHPLFKSAKLPSETLNKSRKTIQVRIGNPISTKQQSELGEISRYGRFLRAKTYALGSILEVKRFYKPTLIQSRKVDDIIDPVPPEVIINEIGKISNDYFLFDSSNFKVFCAPSYEIPNILTEIGRLREITFREIGEGTNRSSDLDEYDLYYHQLVIWDEEAKRIVGAYRIGKGQSILSSYGIKGFYISSLFRIAKPFYPILSESIELGRSFIVKEYQRKPMSLFLLWKGILYFLLKNPEYRYLIGPVSISNEFSKFSKELIVEFIKKHFYNYNFAQHIKPRKKFIEENKQNIDKKIIFENTKDDLNRFDKIIKDIEPKYSMPVLLKKYLKLNAHIIGFNIDPKFNNALDGLLLLDIYDVPISIIESLSKEVNDNSILDRFSEIK